MQIVGVPEAIAKKAGSPSGDIRASRLKIASINF